MKPYIFLNQQYTNLNELALAYKANFNEGINDIYSNTKKLLAFVKLNTKNKDRLKAIKDAIYLTRYKNNALTFVIFELLDIKEVVFNGKVITFKDFVILIKENPGLDNALFAFLEDHGISRTFEKMEPTLSCYKDIYYVEKYYNVDLTYKYLCSIFDYEIKERLEKKFMSIAIQNEECFRRATKFIKSDEFLLGVAHIYGFEAAINIFKDSNGVFYALKLFRNDKRNDVEEDQLRRIVDDAFFWWLYDNFENYEAKGKAKNVFTRLKELKAEYSSFEHNSDNNVKISFEYYIDVSRKLYLYYLEFVHYFRLGLITPSAKVEASLFNLDKPYCMTYISEGYMRGRVIKLYNPTEDNNAGPIINPLTNEVIEAEQLESKDIDEISNDGPIDDLLFLDDYIYNKTNKSIKKMRRFGISIIVFSILLLIAGGASLLLNYIREFDIIYVQIIKAFSTKLNYIATIASGFIGLLFGIAILIYESNKRIALDDLKNLKYITNGEKLTLEDEMHLYRISYNDNDLKKKALSNNRLLSLFASAAITVGFAFLGLLLLAEMHYILFDKFNVDLNEIFNLAKYDENIVKYLILAAPAVLILPFAGLKKKKGFKFALFTVLIGLISAFAVIFIFTKIA